MQIADIMTREVVSITPETSVREIIDLIHEHHVTTLPVLDQGKLVGVVAESDLLVRDAPLHVPAYISFLGSLIPLRGLQTLEEELRKLAGNRARDVMTSPVITVRDTDPTSAAAAIMTEQRLLSLPVVDARGHMVGIVSQGDIVRSLAK